MKQILKPKKLEQAYRYRELIKVSLFFPKTNEGITTWLLYI